MARACGARPSHHPPTHHPRRKFADRRFVVGRCPDRAPDKSWCTIGQLPNYTNRYQPIFSKSGTRKSRLTEPQFSDIFSRLAHTTASDKVTMRRGRLEARRVLLSPVSPWWLDRARLSGSKFSLSASEWLGINPRLIGELPNAATAVRRSKERARCAERPRSRDTLYGNLAKSNF